MTFKSNTRIGDEGTAQSSLTMSSGEAARSVQLSLRANTRERETFQAARELGAAINCEEQDVTGSRILKVNPFKETQFTVRICSSGNPISASPKSCNGARKAQE